MPIVEVDVPPTAAVVVEVGHVAPLEATVQPGATQVGDGTDPVVLGLRPLARQGNRRRVDLVAQVLKILDLGVGVPVPYPRQEDLFDRLLAMGRLALVLVVGGVVTVFRQHRVRRQLVVVDGELQKRRNSGDHPLDGFLSESRYLAQELSVRAEQFLVFFRDPRLAEGGFESLDPAHVFLSLAKQKAGQ